MPRDIFIQDQEWVQEHNLRVLDVKAFHTGAYSISGNILHVSRDGEKEFTMRFDSRGDLEKAQLTICKLRDAWMAEEIRLERRKKRIEKEKKCTEDYDFD